MAVIDILIQKLSHFICCFQLCVTYYYKPSKVLTWHMSVNTAIKDT